MTYRLKHSELSCFTLTPLDNARKQRDDEKFIFSVNCFLRYGNCMNTLLAKNFRRKISDKDFGHFTKTSLKQIQAYKT